MTLITTIILAFIILIIALFGLGIGYFLTGKNKLNCKRCGKPEEKNSNCSICGKSSKKQ